MKKNGFTLVELLSVIIILCITVTIVIVNVDKNIKDASSFANEFQIKSIENAAMLYVEENEEILQNLKYKTVDFISLETLISAGLLTKKNIEKIDNNNLVLIAIIEDRIKVKYTEITKNVIFLNGPSEISIYVGDQYTEMGAYVAIPGTGIIELTTSDIVSNVDTTKQGEYKVKYSYEETDSIERKVLVIN